MRHFNLPFWKLALGISSTGAVVGTIAIVVLESRKQSDEMQQLRGELAQLKAMIHAPRVVVREIHTQQANAPEASPLPLVPEVNAEEHASEVDEAGDEPSIVFQAGLDLYNRSHENELPDARWAGEAEAAIQDAYSGEDFSALRLSADCRSTLCRLDFEYSDAEAGLAAVRRLMSVHAWGHGRRLTHVDSESKRGSSFFVRDGFDPPSL